MFFAKLYLCVIFPVHAQPSTTISLKLTKSFPSKHDFCALVIHIIDLYPLVRSFKVFLLSGALFLVCLFVCFVYACARWLMRVEWALSEMLEELEVEDILSNYSVIRGKCVLVLLS
jgi:hypothetical protein